MTFSAVPVLPPTKWPPGISALRAEPFSPLRRMMKRIASEVSGLDDADRRLLRLLLAALQEGRFDQVAADSDQGGDRRLHRLDRRHRRDQ